MKKFLNNQKGVSLIELILAITLLSIVLITYMAFFTNAFNYNAMTSNKFKGVNYVREKQVELKENLAFKQFIINISDGDSSTELLKANNPGLNLISDIIRTSTPNIFNNNEEYFLLKLNSTPYKLTVYVKRNRDYQVGSTNKGLYRLYIQTFDQNGKLLSESYTYFEYR